MNRRKLGVLIVAILVLALLLSSVLVTFGRKHGSNGPAKRELRLLAGQPEWVANGARSIRLMFGDQARITSISYRRGINTDSVTVRLDRRAVCAGCSVPQGVPPTARVATMTFGRQTHREVKFSLEG